MKTIILSKLDVQNVITAVGVDQLMDELISKLEKAFKDFDPQRTVVPVRDGFSYSSPQQGLVEWMPMLETGKHVMMKLVGYHPRNPELNQLPTILSDFSLYNATTGQVEAIVDGTLLTAIRTGAASAVASRVLAHPESRTVGLIGCGAQAVTQLHAISRLFDIDRVCFFDTDHNTVCSFEQRCRSFIDNASFKSSSLENVVEVADIISVATSMDIGAGPVFADQPTKEHLHINAIGSDFPEKFEVPVEMLKRSFVTPDVRAQAEIEGECQQLEASDIGDEFYEVLRRAEQHVELQKRRTVFDSTGWVLEDYVVTKLFLDHAERLGIGTRVSMGAGVEDPKSPYEFLNQVAQIKHGPFSPKLVDAVLAAQGEV